MPKYRSLAHLPERVTVSTDDMPSMTRQSFKDECDVNRIMAKYKATGLVKVSQNFQDGRYEDLASVDDYHTSLNKVYEAQRAFEELPSSLRARFHNDPSEFLAFVADPKNSDELVKLGLATARAKAAPVVDAPTPDSEPSTGASARPDAGAQRPVDGSDDPAPRKKVTVR